MILLMNTLSVIPSILNIFTKHVATNLDLKLEKILSKFLKNKSIRSKLEIGFNILAFLIQMSTFAIIFTPVLPVDKTWDLCVSIVLISISYWENFIDSDIIGISKQGRESIDKFKKSIELSRHKTLLFVNLWKIALTILIAFSLHSNLFTDIGLLFADNKMHYITFSLQIISSFFCYYFSLLACKLCMQRTSFSLPLLLSFPVFFSLILLLCKFLPADSLLNDNLLTCANDYTNVPLKWIMFCGCLWWLSHLWINRHIWTNISHRNMNSNKEIFFIPSYSNVFIDQHLMLSRKRLKVLEEEEKEGDFAISNEKIMLYSCATMWHENEKETLQLLTSIMRYVMQ